MKILYYEVLKLFVSTYRIKMSLYFTAVVDEQSNFVRFVYSEMSPVYRCNNSLECPADFGFTRCENHLCMCDENFYQVLNKTSETTYCRLCSRKSYAILSDSCKIPSIFNVHFDFYFLYINILYTLTVLPFKQNVYGAYRSTYVYIYLMDF